MVWSPPAPQNNPVYPALRYSQKFSYPLTSREIWFWQIGSKLSYSQIQKQLSGFTQLRGLYYLPGQRQIVSLREKRQIVSKAKWNIALDVCQKLSCFPSIRALYVTGALSMNNSPEDDDIDIMIITAPHTLWLTRLVVSLYLKILGLRRDPYLTEHSSPRVSNKICDNLWLDTDHLAIFPHDLYRAHEFLQAKCLYDKDSVHSRLLSANSWIGEYLPVAYKKQTLGLSQISFLPDTFHRFNPLLIVINYFFYFFQLLYMLPHLTREQINPGYALFHPRTNTIC